MEKYYAYTQNGFEDTIISILNTFVDFRGVLTVQHILNLFK